MQSRTVVIAAGLVAAAGFVKSNTAHTNEPKDHSAIIAAQCKLYTKAMKIEAKAGRDAPELIEVCPGAGQVSNSFSAQSKSVSGMFSAIGAAPPKALAAYGDGGDKVYRVMIARGASVETANALVTSSEFATAARLMNKALAK